jgi:methylisocitrate lyase
MKNTSVFRQYLLAEPIVLLPVVHDALCAKIAAATGFQALAVGGYAGSATLLGQPDVSLLTLTEMADYAGRIADASGLPLLVDGDTGHGNVTNVIRTVRLFEKAGAAAILLEDQVFPKRCGHMSGKEVVPARDMTAKLKAALDARQDQDLVIAARTDVLALEGLSAAIDRACLYRETGADLIFVEAPETVDQMRRLTEEIKAPLLANMIPGGQTPLLPAQELQDMGFAAVAFPTVNTYVIAKAVRENFTSLKNTGSLHELLDHMVHFEEFNNLVGLPQLRDAEAHYYRNRVKNS